MEKELEFEARNFINSTNNQISLIPMKKHLSKEVLKLFNDKNITGFKLKIIKPLKKMPKQKIEIDWSDPEAVRQYKNKMNMERYRLKRMKMLKGGNK